MVIDLINKETRIFLTVFLYKSIYSFNCSCVVFFNSGRYFSEGLYGRAPVMTMCTLQYSGGVTTVFGVCLLILPA